MPRLRFGVCLCAILFPAAPLAAHRLEPISTHFARPFPRGTGSVELTYEYERHSSEARRVQLIPNAEFELGITRRMQFSLEMPLIREKERNEPAVIGGGHLEIGARYLLAGGERKAYAISLNPFVAAPIGNRRLAGHSTEAGVALHLDREFGSRVIFHGNYGWSSTLGHAEPTERFFFHRSAVVLHGTPRWNPVVELLGATNTLTGESELTLQPEVIYFHSAHWEFKAGVPIGLTRSSPGIGFRAQVAWIFGRSGSD